jgi:hypothetical protein
VAQLKRELHRSAKGPVMKDEDWWRLVFDTDTKQLYIEHEWSHLDVRSSAAAASHGTATMDIPTYLNQGGETAGHRELFRLLRTLFDEGPKAA